MKKQKATRRPAQREIGTLIPLSKLLTMIEREGEVNMTGIAKDPKTSTAVLNGLFKTKDWDILKALASNRKLPKNLLGKFLGDKSLYDIALRNSHLPLRTFKNLLKQPAFKKDPSNFLLSTVQNKNLSLRILTDCYKLATANPPILDENDKEEVLLDILGHKRANEGLIENVMEALNKSKDKGWALIAENEKVSPRLFERALDTEICEVLAKGAQNPLLFNAEVDKRYAKMIWESKASVDRKSLWRLMLDNPACTVHYYKLYASAKFSERSNQRAHYYALDDVTNHLPPKHQLSIWEVFKRRNQVEESLVEPLQKKIAQLKLQPKN